MKSGVVYIVDDDPAVRASIETIVTVMGRQSISFDSAEAFLDAVSEPDYGCLTTDVRMLGMSGMQLLNEMRRRRWSLPAIIVTAYADIRIAVESLRSGATTLLEKPCREQELWDAIVEALAISKTAIEAGALRRSVQQSMATLTDGELQVLKQMVDGMPNKFISKLLDISPRTVDIRRRSVLDKMGAENAVHLAATLTRAGIEFRDPTPDLDFTEGEPANWIEYQRRAIDHLRAG